jgi:hypothetical protein
MRSLLLYFGLVGAPLLLLLGILRSGEGLRAPRSIGGEWQLAAPVSGPISHCLSGIDSARTLVVAQSGRWAELSLGPRSDLTMIAVLEGSRLVGRVESRPVMGCPGGPLELSASVNEGGDPLELTGTFALARCAECAPVAIVASRLPRTRLP